MLILNLLPLILILIILLFDQLLDIHIYITNTHEINHVIIVYTYRKNENSCFLMEVEFLGG